MTKGQAQGTSQMARQDCLGENARADDPELRTKSTPRTSAALLAAGARARLPGGAGSPAPPQHRHPSPKLKIGKKAGG